MCSRDSLPLQAPAEGEVAPPPVQLETGREMQQGWSGGEVH